MPERIRSKHLALAALLTMLACVLFEAPVWVTAIACIALIGSAVGARMGELDRHPPES